MSGAAGGDAREISCVDMGLLRDGSSWFLENPASIRSGRWALTQSVELDSPQVHWRSYRREAHMRSVDNCGRYCVLSILPDIR